jgi:hypothetical protein
MQISPNTLHFETGRMVSIPPVFFELGGHPIAINLRLEYPISNTECPIMK